MVLSLKDILNGPHEYRNGQYFPLPKPVEVVPVAAVKPAEQKSDDPLSGNIVYKGKK